MPGIFPTANHAVEEAPSCSLGRSFGWRQMATGFPPSIMKKLDRTDAENIIFEPSVSTVVW